MVGQEGGWRGVEGVKLLSKEIFMSKKEEEEKIKKAIEKFEGDKKESSRRKKYFKKNEKEFIIYPIKGKNQKGKKSNNCKRVTIRFDRYPDVWELLVNKSIDHCRSLNDEVVYCVKEQYKFEQEVDEWEIKG